MQNPEDPLAAPQTAADADVEQASVLPAAEKLREVVVVGDHLDALSEPLNEDELAQLASLVKEDGAAETTIRGHRVLIVGGGFGHSHHLAMAAALARLDMADLVVIQPDEKIIGPELALAELVRKMPMPEPVVIEDYIDDRRGKGKRRKSWESPYGNHGGNFKQQRHRQQNIKAMLRRRGGR
jgi:hypothetical protein